MQSEKDFHLMTAADLLKNPPPKKKVEEKPNRPKKTFHRDGKTALMKATDLLAYQDQSSKNLKRKLIARKYEEPEVDDAIEKLKKYNYLDDEAACTRQFEVLYNEGKLNIRQIFVKLIRRGFDENFIRKLIPEDADEHDKKIAEISLAKKFKSVNFEELDAKEKSKFKSKLWQHLATRGFETETIQFAIEKFFAF